MPEALDDGAAVFGHAALTLWHWALRPKELATVQPQGRAASILSGPPPTFKSENTLFTMAVMLVAVTSLRVGVGHQRLAQAGGQVGRGGAWAPHLYVCVWQSVPLKLLAVRQDFASEHSFSPQSSPLLKSRSAVAAGVVRHRRWSPQASSSYTAPRWTTG